MVLTFPTERTRAACYACFDFAEGATACPVCGRGTGKRLPLERRPIRPPMFKDQPHDQ